MVTNLMHISDWSASYVEPNLGVSLADRHVGKTSTLKMHRKRRGAARYGLAKVFRTFKLMILEEHVPKSTLKVRDMFVQTS